MKNLVGIITPVIGGQDLNSAEAEFLLHTAKTKQKMSLKKFHELSTVHFDISKLKNNKSLHNTSKTAAGYYLEGLLREQGYNTMLTNAYDEETLKSMANRNPAVVCVSTTMIFSRRAMQTVIRCIRNVMPDVMIVVGGMFLWKGFVFLNSRDNYDETVLGNENIYKYLAFPCTKQEIDADVLLIAQHGGDCLLQVIHAICNGNKKNLHFIPNLALPDLDGNYQFTERKTENIDYNSDITRWDLIDELPRRIPIRTSIGCPYRCGFCDFHELYPKIFMRSYESMMTELRMIKDILGHNSHNYLMDIVDDNAFITPKRVDEVCRVLVESNINMGWTGLIRSSSVNKDNINAIRKSNLLSCLIGFESGDDGQLKRMRKMQTASEQKEGIELLDKSGISSVLSLVVGYPGETDETIANTGNFLNSLDTNMASYVTYPLFVMPASYMSTAKARQEYGLKGMWTEWEHETMSSDEVLYKCYNLFKQVDSIPFTYTEEDLFFNLTRFRPEQRKELYGLRKKLTVQYLDKREWKEKEETFKKINKALGFQDMPIPRSLEDSIECSVSI